MYNIYYFRIKDNLARHKNDLHAMLHESVDYMANTNSDLGNSSIVDSAGIDRATSSGLVESRKSSSGLSGSTCTTANASRRFGFTDVFQRSVLYPFLVILVLMFLLQFSGQGKEHTSLDLGKVTRVGITVAGAITFYTAMIFDDAQSSVDPNDCALVIGVTYFLSSILGLVLKKHVGRRILLLASEFGMAFSQIAMGIYFYVLGDMTKNELR